MSFDLEVETETFDTGKQGWLGSAHGTDTCDSGTLDADTFLAAFPTGIVPAGVAVRKNVASGKYRPAADAGADGDYKILFTRANFRGTTAGTAKDQAVALFWHGQIIEAKLPAGHGVDAAVRTGLPLINFIQ